MKLALKSSLLFAFLVVSSSIVLALPPSTPPPPGPCEDPTGDCDPSGVPFDGGVSLVLAAGAGIGAYKLRKKNKAQQ